MGTEKQNIKNPFAKSDGSPADSKEPEFFEWENQRAKAALEKKPDEERKKIIEYEQLLIKRMNS